MRYGLKRDGLYGYRVDGPRRSVVIRRHHSGFIAGDADRPLVPGFFCQRFRRLRDAAGYAHDWAGCYSLRN